MARNIQSAACHRQTACTPIHGGNQTSFASHLSLPSVEVERSTSPAPLGCRFSINRASRPLLLLRTISAQFHRGEHFIGRASLSLFDCWFHTRRFCVISCWFFPSARYPHPVTSRWYKTLACLFSCWSDARMTRFTRLGSSVPTTPCLTRCHAPT